ncbi:Transmembrane efflux pump [Candidatus Saccharibacteria bacterium RAAC3_TM7_1]|nr:Transmembrane efflux pump [Candidatus Saccharibacteria bacterium RAAC3_TM7_1]
MTKQRLVLFIAVLASFVAFLDGSVVSVALPQISEEFGGNLLIQQWVNDAYLITLGMLILAAGSLSDIFGRKKVLLAGLVGFLVTSLFCALAQSGEQLVIARGLQGIAGALLVPSSLALIMSVFRGAAQSKAIGQWTGWTGVAFIVGPLIGGLMVDLFSWRLVFAINVIPIAAALILATQLRFDDKTRERARLDILGIVLGAVGLGGLVYALIEQGNFGWSHLSIWGTFAVGAVSLLFFVLHEARTKQPMLPLELFRVRNFSVGNIATFFIYAALSLQGFLLVIFLQQVAGFSATMAGLSSLPITIIMFFLSSRFGALSGKYGSRLFMSVGPIVAGIGTLYMLMAKVPTNYWMELLPGILLFGLGLSITVAPLTSAILGSIKSSQAGIGSAVNNAAARIAGLLSVAMIGLFVGKNIDLDGFYVGIIFCSTLLIAGGVVSAIGIQNKKT